MGPVYLFICGAWLHGAILLAINYVLIICSIFLFATVKLSFYIGIAVAVYCGANANRITQKPMQQRHTRYLELYRSKGYTGRELTEIVRKKELGFVRIMGGFLLAIFMYWGARTVIGVLLALLIINIEM
jgi:hypothetical protein